jgi:tetratricopeptide (TPR) repeat protein
MKDIQRAFDASREEKGIAIFERLKAENPENVVVKNRYRRFCYEWITFRLLTREQITDEILKRCLRLQTIKAELEPENPQTIASLAYFYARLNYFDQAISNLKRAIRMDPENSGYHKTLEVYVETQKRVGKANDS